jgi:hypothetical protein
MNHVLGKIGRHDRMRALVERGTVFMRRLSAYPQMTSPVIGDPNEGLYARYTAENPTLKTLAKIGTKTIPLPGTSITVPSTARNHAVYCMCGFQTPGDGTLPMSSLMPIASNARMRDFGDTLIIFKDTVEFVRRLEKAAQRAGHELEHGPVQYMPSVYCGEMGPFRKLDSYKYQSEWRVITATPIAEATLTLNLGTLLDVALRVDLNEINTSS